MCMRSILISRDVTAELIVVINGQELRFPLSGFNIIGRGQDAAVRLMDFEVSREHSSIRCGTSGCYLNDLGSANGTYVNGLAVTGSQKLSDGDEISFGNVQARFSFLPQTSQAESDSKLYRTLIVKRTDVKVITTPLILFVADIRGFTAISSRISAQELADCVRAWYDDCRLILEPLGAQIDKFIGDAVFAYWRDTGTDARLAALDAARALRDGLALDPAIRFQCRVGLHAGDVALGSMTKGNNTALGDAVNLAFRIESLNRTLGTSVLASAAFLSGWGEGRALFSPQGYQPIKGHPAPVEVFSLDES